MRALALAALSLLALDCGAAQCDAKEYAQYKDSARTAIGQEFLAMDYCRMREAGDCVQERGKIVDALLAAREPKLVQWAQSGCVGDAPGRPRSAQPSPPAPPK